MEVGRVLAVVAAALVACFATLGAVVWLTRDEDEVAVDGLLAERLSLEVAKADRLDRPLELATLTDFAWDRVYIAAPDTDDARLDAALGFDFRGDDGFIEGPLLVFVHDGELARFTDYRGEGRFDGIRTPIAAFDRDRAVFDVRQLVIRPRR